MKTFVVKASYYRNFHTHVYAHYHQSISAFHGPRNGLSAEKAVFGIYIIGARTVWRLHNIKYPYKAHGCLRLLGSTLDCQVKEWEW